MLSLFAISLSVALLYAFLLSFRFERWYYDFTHENSNVDSEAKIHEILSKLEKVHFSKLPKSFAESGMYNHEKYKYLYRDSKLSIFIIAQKLPSHLAP
jgi:hypothetical protein